MLASKYGAIRGLEELLRTGSLVVTVSHLVPALQRERDASTVYLASDGARLARELPGLRADSDIWEADFRQRVAAIESASGGRIAPVRSAPRGRPGSHQRHAGRAALVPEDRLMGCPFMESPQSLPGRSWLAGLCRREILSASDSQPLLAGQPPAGARHEGPLVCPCFGVCE